MDSNSSLDRLQNILDNVNNWLHFIEAKNGALIAFNIALISAFIGSDFINVCHFIFYGVIFGLLLSTFFSLWSFRPINKTLPKTELRGLQENLLHYAYIASLDKTEFIVSFYERYMNEHIENTSTIPKLDLDYFDEIIQNARITTIKQIFFNRAFTTLIITLCVILGMIICA